MSSIRLNERMEYRRELHVPAYFFHNLSGRFYSVCLDLEKSTIRESRR